MTPLVTPTLHLNGTSSEALCEQRVAVMDAARALLDAMKDAEPNSRDYYPQGDAQWVAARTAWQERMDAVRQIIDEVQMDTLKLALAAAK